MRLGTFQVNAVETGRFRLDGGAMFGVVPKVLWEKTNPADEKNRITMALRSLLIRGEGRTILVDCGAGTKWSDKLIDIYAIDHSQYDIDTSLAALGIHRDQVTDVVLTHLHFDHVGGATRYNEQREVVLSFPNATYYVQEENLSHAHAPSEKDRASFIDSTIAPLQQSGRIKSLKGDSEIVPGVKILVNHGHTPGQNLVTVTGDNKTVLFCGDTIPTASHIPVPYVMGFDLYPMTTIQEKKKLLQKAVEEDWILCFAHDPVTAACTVRLFDGKFSRGNDVEL